MAADAQQLTMVTTLGYIGRPKQVIQDTHDGRAAGQAAGPRRDAVRPPSLKKKKKKKKKKVDMPNKMRGDIKTGALVCPGT